VFVVPEVPLHAFDELTEGVGGGRLASKRRALVVMLVVNALR
jgi:hypothetical protein